MTIFFMLDLDFAQPSIYFEHIIKPFSGGFPWHLFGVQVPHFVLDARRPGAEIFAQFGILLFIHFCLFCLEVLGICQLLSCRQSTFNFLVQSCKIIEDPHKTVGTYHLGFLDIDRRKDSLLHTTVFDFEDLIKHDRRRVRLLFVAFGHGVLAKLKSR